MNNQPLISIIVPIYKVQDYIRECLDSILIQTYTNLEIILVDDGSPDGCPEICDSYAMIDPRIIVLHKENGGLSDARNAGLDICKGEYIAFVDSDDIIHPQFIDILFCNIGDSDFVFCDIQKFNLADNPKWEVHETIRDGVKFSKEQVFEKFYGFKNGTLVVAWNKLYRRNIWNELRYPKGKIHEDEFVIHKIIDSSRNVTFIDLKLYGYRIRPGSIIQSKSEASLFSIIEVYNERERFFMAKGMKAHVNEIYYRKRVFFLRDDVGKNFKFWKEYTVKEIMLDKIPFKIKTLLLLKKLIPSFYSFLKK